VDAYSVTDPSHAAFWLPGQDTAVESFSPVWSQ
jgi:hypothetical protein